MNLHVLGWYNHGNVGDEAFKLAFPLVLPQHNLSFVEDLSDSDSDMVILGGGDVISPAFTSKLSKKSYLPQQAMSVSVTSNSDFNYINKHLDKVYVRDYRSLEIALAKGVAKDKVEYLPDFTFTLTPNREAGRRLLMDLFSQAGHDLYQKVVVCVISSYMSHNGLDALGRDLTSFLKLSQDIAVTADNTNASFVFLPFSTKPPWDDCMTGSWVASRCKFYQKNFAVWQHSPPYGVQDTLNIIAAADAVVSSRLHASIFSTISGVPFIDITHHSKNLGFIQTIGKKEWSNPFWEFSIRDFRESLSLFLDQEVPHPHLEEFTKQAKGQLRDAALLR